MTDRTDRDLHDTHDERSAVRLRRRADRARLLAAAILTMALVGALVPLSAFAASPAGNAVAGARLQTATRTATMVATAVGTAPRTVTPSPTTAAPATATMAPTVVAAPATATAVVPGMPRTGSGGTLWGIELAWLSVAAFGLLALAGAATVAARRRRVS